MIYYIVAWCLLALIAAALIPGKKAKKHNVDSQTPRGRSYEPHWAWRRLVVRIRIFLISLLLSIIAFAPGRFFKADANLYDLIALLGSLASILGLFFAFYVWCGARERDGKLKKERSRFAETVNTMVILLFRFGSIVVFASTPHYAAVWYIKGKRLYRKNLFKKALICFANSVTIKTDYVLAWNSKGRAHEKLNQPMEADESYSRATEIDPAFAGAWENKGNLLKKQGRHDEAQIAFKHAACAWDNKGKKRYEAGRLHEALKFFTKAIEINADYEPALGNRAVVLAKLGRYQQALDARIKALRTMRPSASGEDPLVTLLVDLVREALHS